MLNIISHHRNANLTIVRYHIIPTEMAVVKKGAITSVGKDVEKLVSSHTADGNIE